MLKAYNTYWPLDIGWIRVSKIDGQNLTRPIMENINFSVKLFIVFVEFKRKNSVLINV